MPEWKERSDEADRKFIGLVRRRRTGADWVRQALASGANPNAMHNEMTVLMAAARLGDIEKVRALLDGGADPNLPGKGAMPCALYAWAGGGFAINQPEFTFDRVRGAAIARLLIERGCDVQATGSYPYPPLFSIQRLDVVCVLVECGVDPNRKSELRAERGGIAGIFSLMTKYGAEGLMAMRERGVRLDVVDDESGENLFHAMGAFSGGDTVIDGGGYAPAMLAMAGILGESGADIDLCARAWAKPGQPGGTPLMLVARGDYGTVRTLAAIDALLAHGADLHARDAGGNTVLHRAQHGWCVQRLIEAGCDIEARNRQGQRPDEAILARAQAVEASNGGGGRGWALARAREASAVIQGLRAARAQAAFLDGAKPGRRGRYRA